MIEKQKAHDLIFLQLLSEGPHLQKSVRTWNLSDSKLWYLTDKQAKGFLEVEKNQTYKTSVTDLEIALLKEHVPNLMAKLPEQHYNLLDLGCGDGRKAAMIIDFFNQKNKEIRYCPIDINAHMVKSAIETIKNKISVVADFHWNVSDFENLVNITPLFRNDLYTSNILLLLGNTLGNFEEQELMHMVYQSMEQDDALVIGNGLSTFTPEQIIKAYDIPEIKSFTMSILEQLDFKEEELEYGVRFENSKVEVYHRVLTAKHLVHLGHQIEFEKGDEITTVKSYKYSLQDIERITARFFQKVEIHTDEAQSYGLVFCSV